jgi:hypothetical protein
MLAVAGAQFQVAESPIIAEVKRRLATRNCPCCQQPMRFMGVVKRTTNLIPKPNVEHDNKDNGLIDTAEANLTH